MKKEITDIILDSISTSEKICKTQADGIAKIAEVILDAAKKGNKVLVFGNGGSAADSQHMAAELVGRFIKDRAPIPAIALTTNTSTLTAVGNDYGFQDVFVRQLQALGRKGDIAVGISTSGNSDNVIKAIETAKKSGLTTVVLTGKDGGKLAKIADLVFIAPSKDTPRIQESHILVIHAICQVIEKKMFE